MFFPVSDYTFEHISHAEFIWTARTTNGLECLLAGALLGNEVVRIRAVRGRQLDEASYQVVDGIKGRLPYHSWIVARGDESWEDTPRNEQALALLEAHLRGLAFSSDAVRLTRPLADQESIFGLGEHTGAMNKRGRAFPIWNVDPPVHYNAQTPTMYTSIPFFLSFHPSSGQASGLLIDHTGLIDMDIGHTRAEEASMTVQGDHLVVYYFTGPTAADVLRQYTALTGRISMPPRWALGYHQSRWGYRTEEQVREVARKLRERQHPCDAIWLDIDYMNGYRIFTWDTERFPDPQQLTQELHGQGLHAVSIIDPGIKIDDDYFLYRQFMSQDYFCQYPDGPPFIGRVWPGECVFPDFSRRIVRAWWGDLYRSLLEIGIDAFWNDMNEPAVGNILNPDKEARASGTTMSGDVLHGAGGGDPTGPDGPPVRHAEFHNAYGMEMARATYEGLGRLRPDIRPFVLTRSGTAGMQRYASLWTGDNTSKWEYVSMAIPMCLNIGMSGVPFVGVDIGGFYEACNGELLVRFGQLGALLPFCRNHNTMNSPAQEPWAFGEPYESAFRLAIELRYRLMPYLYTLFHDASTTGAPVMRPLYYHYPQDPQACDNDSEFLVGEALLSTPILEQGATGRQVYLPAGYWFDYWDGTIYSGTSWHYIPASLDRWPLFVRSNSILPTGPLMQYTNQHPTDPLTISCYMLEGGQTSFTLYEDDGATFAYAHGDYALISMSCKVEHNIPIVKIEERFDRYRPQRQWYEIVVHFGNQVRKQRVKAGQGMMSVQLSS